MNKDVPILILLLLTASLYGCGTSTKALLAAEESQVKPRSMQTRAFDTTRLIRQTSKQSFVLLSQHYRIWDSLLTVPMMS